MLGFAARPPMRSRHAPLGRPRPSSFALPATAEAAPRWTFCVAASEGGADVWISDVFAAEGNRERLEARVQERGRAARRVAATAQCPLPRDDKTVAVNAQFDAEAFNRKMGATLHRRCRERTFPPRR